MTTIACPSGSCGCLDDGARKTQTRKRKLRPKPEGIKDKLELVIFGSVHGLSTWAPRTIKG